MNSVVSLYVYKYRNICNHLSEQTFSQKCSLCPTFINLIIHYPALHEAYDVLHTRLEREYKINQQKFLVQANTEDYKNGIVNKTLRENRASSLKHLLDEHKFNSNAANSYYRVGRLVFHVYNQTHKLLHWPKGIDSVKRICPIYEEEAQSLVILIHQRLAINVLGNNSHQLYLQGLCGCIDSTPSITFFKSHMQLPMSKIQCRDPPAIARGLHLW